MYNRDDARWFSDTVGAIYTAQTIADFSRTAIAAIHRHFRAVATACEEVDYSGSSYILHGARCEIPPPADHAAHIHDNPFVPLLGSTRMPAVQHMRGRFSFAAWRRTDHFNGVARPMGWSDMLDMVTQAKPSVVVVGLHRDAVFSWHEVELIRLLQPHMLAAWCRVRHAVGNSRIIPPLHLTLSPEPRPFLASAEQRSLLRAYFPQWREADMLPAELRAWVVHSLEQLRQRPPHMLRTFITECAHGQLLVRCFPGRDGSTAQLCFVETRGVPDFFRLRATGLTTRECEVLHWLAQGKRDVEIAAIIACAPTTVSKHVEHILRKLHVENRTAAVMAARERLDCG